MKHNEQELNVPLTEKLKSIPEIIGIRLNEEPHYEVLNKYESFEVRRYNSLLLASYAVVGEDFDDFRETAFKALAGYIFGGNKEKVNVAMTAPVLCEQTDEREWTMSFVLPSKYNLSSAPRPLDSGIQIALSQSFDAAVTRFSGNNSLASINSHKRDLSNWLATQPQLRPKGEFIVAQYDGPFALPFVKRNEVMQKVTLHT